MDSENSQEVTLAEFIRRQMNRLNMTQCGVCKNSLIDQALLCKLVNGTIDSVELENAMRLAVGIDVPIAQILALVGRQGLHDLAMRVYSSEFTEVVLRELSHLPPEVLKEVKSAIEKAGDRPVPQVRSRKRRL